MTLHKITSVSKHKPGEERVEYVFSPWTANVLEMKTLAQCPGLTVVVVEAAPPETAAVTPMVEPGDVVTVQEGPYRGCILDLLAVTQFGTFVLRNQYGDYEPAFDDHVIRARAVSFLRKPQTRIEAYD